MNPRQVHRAFLRRQSSYEKRYSRMIRKVLKRQYIEAARVYPQVYTVDPNDYRAFLTKLYTTILPIEAEQCWKDFVEPLGSENKDFFDDLMRVLGISVSSKGEWIRIWRDTARSWLELHILSKIENIASTTQRAIAKVIEDKLNQEEGTSIPEIRQAIVKASDGDVNKHRANLIARTETVAAMNKGRRVSIMSSGIEYSKKWLDTPDSRTRLSHREIAKEEYRPINSPYWLVDKNGQLEQAQYPGDPQLSPENCIQCRCTELYEVVRDSAGRPVRVDSSIIDVSELILQI